MSENTMSERISGRQIQVEAFLDIEGAAWHYAGWVKIDDVDIVNGVNQQARFTKFNKDNHDDYARVYRQGHPPMPPIVLFVMPSGKYGIIDGNHRINAAKSVNLNEIEAYVVDSNDPLLIERLRRAFNRLNGERVSSREAMAHAVHLVLYSGHSELAVAEELNLDKWSVYSAVRAARARQRIEKHGIDTTKMERSALERIQRIPLDSVLVPVARLIQRAQLPSDQASKLASAIMEKTSETDMLAVVAEWEQSLAGRIAANRNGTIRPPAPVRASEHIMRGINTAVNQLGRFPRLPKQISPDEWRRIQEAYLNLAERIETMANAS